MFDESIVEFPRKVSDREGILAFALAREKFTPLQIGDALGLPTISVNQFFEHYPRWQPFSRCLRVPDDLTPEKITRFVERQKLCFPVPA